MAAHDKVLHALADPTRRAILDRLRQAPRSVGDIASGLPVSRPAVSQHLRVLEGAGLVRARRETTRRVYSVEVKGIVELRRYLDRMWDEALASLQAFAADGAPKKGARRGR
jgi:DNA-binding transcriptional ArsR family regulator